MSTDRTSVHKVKIKDGDWMVDLAAIVEVRTFKDPNAMKPDHGIVILFKGSDRQQARDFETAEERDRFIQAWIDLKTEQNPFA